MIKRITSEELSKEDIIKNLEYAANVLEIVYIDETKYVSIYLIIPLSVFMVYIYIYIVWINNLETLYYIVLLSILCFQGAHCFIKP